MSYSKISIIGNLGTSPKIFKKNEVTYCSFQVAQSRVKKSENGQHEVVHTNWYPVCCSGGIAVRASQLSKGDMVFVEGQLEINRNKEHGISLTLWAKDIFKTAPLMSKKSAELFNMLDESVDIASEN